MNILLGGKETLEERFSEIDAKKVREELEKSRNEESVISPIKIEHFYRNISKLEVNLLILSNEAPSQKNYCDYIL